MKRFARLVLVLAALLGIGLAVAGPASAQIYNYRKLTGFDRWPSQTTFNGNWVGHDAYRISSSAVRFQFSNEENGDWKIQVQVGGNLGEAHEFIAAGTHNDLSTNPTWSVDWVDGLGYWWWMTFYPDSGGSLVFHFYLA